MITLASPHYMHLSAFQDKYFKDDRIVNVLVIEQSDLGGFDATVTKTATVVLGWPDRACRSSALPPGSVGLVILSPW